MLITKELVTQSDACLRWLNIFEYRYPNGLLIETKHDLVKALSLGGFAPVLGFIQDNLKLFDLEHLKNTKGYLDLANCDFSDANLIGFCAEEVDFSGSNFYEADLRLAEFRECDFIGSDLALTALSHAAITSCDFTSGALRYSNLRGACIAFSCFDETDLSGVSITSEKSFGAPYSFKDRNKQ